MKLFSRLFFLGVFSLTVISVGASEQKGEEDVAENGVDNKPVACKTRADELTGTGAFIASGGLGEQKPEAEKAE